jgi:pyruvate,water dikinase
VLIPLREAEGRCGAKAANLGRLLRAGFDVPAGFVISDAIGDDGWGQELEPALRDLGSGRFAVRSSAFGEDGGQAAGNVVPVIVQVMVEPEAAGVLFTRHPVSGADQVVIEAAGGLGTRLWTGRSPRRPGPSTAAGSPDRALPRRR